MSHWQSTPKAAAWRTSRVRRRPKAILRSKTGRASHRRTQKANRVSRNDPASQDHQRYSGQKPIAGHGDAEDHDRQCARVASRRARSDQRQDRAGLAYSRVPAGCDVASRELRGARLIRQAFRASVNHIPRCGYPSESAATDLPCLFALNRLKMGVDGKPMDQLRQGSGNCRRTRSRVF